MPKLPTALVILAGGAATRLPSKLEQRIGGAPMLVHVYRNLCGFTATYISISRDLNPAISAQIHAEVIVDRTPLRGPLSALVTAFNAINAERIFVVAADMPLVTRSSLEQLAAHWQQDDEAIAARDAGGATQPLLAVYDRQAFLRVAEPLNQRSGVKDVLPRLRWRAISLADPLTTLNVNTQTEYLAVRNLCGMRA